MASPGRSCSARSPSGEARRGSRSSPAVSTPGGTSKGLDIVRMLRGNWNKIGDSLNYVPITKINVRQVKQVHPNEVVYISGNMDRCCP